MVPHPRCSTTTLLLLLPGCTNEAPTPAEHAHSTTQRVVSIQLIRTHRGLFQPDDPCMLKHIAGLCMGLLDLDVAANDFNRLNVCLPICLPGNAGVWLLMLPGPDRVYVISSCPLAPTAIAGNASPSGCGAPCVTMPCRTTCACKDPDLAQGVNKPMASVTAAVAVLTLRLGPSAGVASDTLTAKGTAACTSKNVLSSPMLPKPWPMKQQQGRGGLSRQHNAMHDHVHV